MSKPEQQIRGANARLKAFIDRHADSFDEADFRKSDLALLVKLATQRKTQRSTP